MYVSCTCKCISPTIGNVFLLCLKIYFSHIGKCISPTLGNVFLPHWEMYFSYITGCPWCSSRPANSFDQPNHVKSDRRQNIPEQFNIQRKYPEMISWYPEMISRDHNIQRWYSKLIFQRGIQRPEIILPLMSCASLPKYGPSFVPWSQVYSDEFLSGPDMIISCWRSWICKNVPPLTCRCLFYLCRLRQELFMVLCGIN